MATAKTKMQRMFVVLLCVILAYTCAGHSFLGPGISAETAIGTITATDMADFNENIDLNAISPPANAVQYKNVVVTISLNQANIDSATLEILSFSPSKFHKYTNVDISVNYAMNMVDTSVYQNSNRIYLDFYNSGELQVNQKLVRLYYNVPAMVENPLSLVSFSVSNVIYTDSTGTGTPFSYQKVLLGDVNNDLTVDTLDAQQILRYVSNKVEFDEAQVLAGDVNFDGITNSLDSMIIMKYPVQKVLSFCDPNRVNLPTGTAQGIASKFIYQIKNAQTGHRLTVDTNNNVYFSSMSNHDRCRFAIELADSTRPIYYIKNVSNGKYVRLNQSYKTTCIETNAITNSQYWYVIPVSNGFQLVNFACPDKTLTKGGSNIISTTNCSVDYIDSGNVWQVEDQRIVIRYFYDNGMQSRYGSNFNDVLDNIESKQSDIASIITNVFGIGVVMEEPVYKQSYADLCSASYSSNCPSIHATTTSCITNTGGADLSLVHHKNSNAMLRYLYNGKTNANKHELFVMFSGHIPCAKDANGNHVYKSQAGSAIRGYNVCQVFRNGGTTANDGTQYRDQYTALHEISHCLGAIVDKEGGLTPDTNHGGGCVMSYQRDEDELDDYWDDSELQSLLYCDDCRELIEDYLSNSLDS